MIFLDRLQKTESEEKRRSRYINLKTADGFLKEKKKKTIAERRAAV